MQFWIGARIQATVAAAVYGNLDGREVAAP